MVWTAMMCYILSNCVTYSMLCCDSLTHAHMCTISPYKIINFRSKIQDETVCFFNFFSKGILCFLRDLYEGVSLRAWEGCFGGGELR